MTRLFADRADAGRQLAALARYRLAEFGPDALERLIVLGLPRGGVPVAAPVADALGAPLDVLVVRKLGVPGHPELAMGALASLAGRRVTVTNEDVLANLAGNPERALARVSESEGAELERRESAYRADRPPLNVAGSRVLLVDDGVATGATVKAAIGALRAGGAASVTVAVPVAPADTLAELRELADEVLCVSTPDPFWAVGQAYVDFAQTSDDEVIELLR